GMPWSTHSSNTTVIARDVSAIDPPGVGFAQSAFVPGGPSSNPPVLKPCAVLELKYMRTFGGSGTGLPRPSTCPSEPWSCQNSLAESICMTTGSVAGRFMMPSVIPEIGSVVTAHVNGGYA